MMHSKGELALSSSSSETTDAAITPVPRVTAIMVTGKTSLRLPLARLAVRAFEEQTYPSRELLIVNTAHESLGVSNVHVTELHMPGNTATLGELRNLALSHARGEWVIQWDDDDWHHPRRMEEQMQHAEQDAACLLARQIRLSLETGEGLVYYERYGIHGTILHHRNVKWRYPLKGRAEDTEFLTQFPKRRVVDNAPSLYIRFYHGHNTWDEKHIMSCDPKHAPLGCLPGIYRELCNGWVAQYRAAISLVDRNNCSLSESKRT